jgi:WhiB family redox-sensing transcriptional regulator
MYREQIQELIEVAINSELDYFSRRRLEMFCSEFEIKIEQNFKEETKGLLPSVPTSFYKENNSETSGEKGDEHNSTKTGPQAKLKKEIPKAVKSIIPGGGFIIHKSIKISAIPITPDEDWHDYANCLGVDPDLFFPERGASTRESKEVCRGCEVRHDCLEFALQNGEKFGIWGGLSERERRRIRRIRSQANKATIAP